MTAIKPREPNTFFSAVADVINAAGVDAAAAAVDLTPSSVYQWSNGDSGKRPSLMQAAALDRAAFAANGTTPISDVMKTMAKRGCIAHVAADFGDRMMMVVKEIGDIAEARRAAMMPGSRGGASITPTEYCHISREISEAREALEALQRDLDDERERSCVPVRGVARA